MQLGYVGINYKNTDLSVRDKITFTDSGIADFMQQAEEAGASAYYTSADGLVKITTLNVNNSVLASGYYAFDKDGYLLTGRNAVGNDFYYFRTEGDVQIVNALSADKKTPYNSQLGQAISDTWIWDAGQGAFNYYGHDNGKQVNLEANKIYSINGASEWW